MLTSKQRAHLRSLAAAADTILHIGKGGISGNIITQANDALSARELIKCRVLENTPLSPREAAEQIAQKTGGEVVQVIGSKFVLYRRNPKETKIILPR